MRVCTLPSREECIELLRECHVPVHIVKHSKAVAKLAVFMAEETGGTTESPSTRTWSSGRACCTISSGCASSRWRTSAGSSSS